ncbi:LmeA family phospholipid-binding protein [Agromyces sp. NPDC004153]
MTRSVPATDAAGAPPRRRNRAARAWITVLVILGVLVALAVVADLVVRNVAEQRVAEQLEQNLPAGVEGDVQVRLGGFSVIAQYLSGSMEQVDLSAPELTVNGVPIAVHVEAQDVPPGLDAPVGRATATIQVTEAAVNTLIEVPGVQGDVVLGDGAVAYSDSVRVLGIPIDYTVTARPTAAGDTVFLEPTGVEVGAGGGAIDVSGLVDRLMGDDPIPVCVAEYLPEGVEVQQLTVEPGSATVTLGATGISLDEQSLATRGSCG